MNIINNNTHRICNINYIQISQKPSVIKPHHRKIDNNDRRIPENPIAYHTSTQPKLHIDAPPTSTILQPTTDDATSPTHIININKTQPHNATDINATITNIATLIKQLFHQC